MKECNIEGIPSLIPFHRRMLEEPAFTATGPEGFTLHTNWIETECTWLPELIAPLPTGVKREEVIREWFEVDGKWVRLGFPAALLGSGGAPRGTKAAEVVPEGVKATMNGSVTKWLVANGETVSNGQSLGILEAMKMEMPIVADNSGVFTAAVPEGTVVKEGQILATIA